jgi:branched-chain amino acid transport system ATP-binding protein
MLALIGPNGAGKTTCFNMVGGQLAPDCRLGHARRRRAGRPEAEAIWRQGVGRTFQIAETFASLTVRENVQLALLSHDRRVLGAWRAARPSTPARPTRCSRASACRRRPSGR